jgi:FKBP-type peptidyl-prolyl cis-trans isomerase FklB|tara:strand:+ start:113 stop:865 length:753 start_codon:yes stop_codon:yes gene_type:complete
MNNSIKILIIICSLALLANCDNSSNIEEDEKLLMVTFEDSLSYSIGVTMGKNLPDAEFNHDLVQQGLNDYFNKKEPRLNNADRQVILREFNVKNSQIERDQMELATADARDLSRKNKMLGQEFLDKNKLKEGVLVRERSGLQYKVIVKGSGIIPDYDDRVVIHYTGYLIDGYKFDSSYNMGTPLTLEVARFIPGWQEALLMMPVGSKWEIYVPYNLAYGDAGIQGSNLGEYVIPPSSTLIFEMELLAIAK